MQQTKYTTRVYIDSKYPNVMIRVCWLSKKRTLYFSLGCKADRTKWDTTTQRAHVGTIHKVSERAYSARFINSKIEHKLDFIAKAFLAFDIRSEVPTVEQLRECVQLIEKDNMPTTGRINKTLEELYEDFLVVCSDERNWTEVVHYKYQQIWKQLHSSDPNISLETLTKERMINLKNWYVDNGYRNVTITKQFKILKSFLRWVKSEGYDIEPGVIEYKVNLKVVPKRVTFLKYKELIDFMNFQFPESKGYLARARDFFCFMCFTSLRYSDLKALRKASVGNDYLTICTKKTSDSLRIPLVDQAKAILAPYWENAKDGEPLFPVPANQKLNEFLKEAAKLAGLNREVMQTYYIGTTRHDDTFKFYEQISCHDARRTFVCISLSLGIPATTVMSCTGHKDYESMKPYIEVADETQMQQMAKWSTQTIKSSLIQLMDEMTPQQLVKLMEAAISPQKQQ